MASARNVLTDHFNNVAGTDSKVTVNGTEYGLSKTKLQAATDKMNETLARFNSKVFSEGLEYELNEDGVSYSVIGIGTCTDTDIVIPDTYEGLPVTALKSHIECIEGEENTYLQERGTFENCTDLISIVIPNSITGIGNRAFEYCKSLTSVTIGNSVTSIGNQAFYGCSELTSITIPDSVTSIGDRAFYGCSKLTSVTIPDSVTSIGSDAFNNTGYYNNELNWENDVLYIGKYLITAKNTITGAYTVKSGTKLIADSAFYYCSNLTSVTIPDSVTSIGRAAFYNCRSLIDIYINKPEGSISLGSDWCPSTTTIHWNSTGPEN